MDFVRLIGYIAMAYLGIGVVTMIVMHAGALKRIDPSTAGSGFIFRLLISPGLVALWPVIIMKFIRGNSAGALESPVTATGLRRLHRTIIAIIAVVVPIAAGAGLWNRPPIQPIEERIAGEAIAWSVDWTPSGSQIVTARALHVIQEPQLVYWLTPQSESPIFLGAIDRAGEHFFTVPTNDRAFGGAVRIYTPRSGEWKTALQLGGAA